MGWDKGLNLENIIILILQKLKKAKHAKTRTYLCILLIQAMNGSRISEAIRAFQTWVKTGENLVQVQVSKKRGKRVLRYMFIPRIFDKLKPLLDLSLANENEAKLTKRIKVFAVRNLKINTHSIRYAYITFCLTTGFESALVSRWIGHANLKHLTTYVQAKQAKDMFTTLAERLEELMEQYFKL